MLYIHTNVWKKNHTGYCTFPLQVKVERIQIFQFFFYTMTGRKSHWICNHFVMIQATFIKFYMTHWDFNLKKSNSSTFLIRGWAFMSEFWCNSLFSLEWWLRNVMTVFSEGTVSCYTIIRNVASKQASARLKACKKRCQENVFCAYKKSRTRSGCNWCWSYWKPLCE